MFRRNWDSLPKDASFPSTLKDLGYFVNAQDEIRSIADPDYYFKYFLNKNSRVNDRQRFEFNGALGRIVEQRLQREGLQKVPLPLHATEDKPHVNIFTSPNLSKSSRIVVIFGEPLQDLGILAGRVANGPGGINKGSLVSVVRVLKEHHASLFDLKPPGIVLANMGHRFWWPEGKRALTISESAAIPLPSMVHTGRQHVSAANDIPGSESAQKHLETIFRIILGACTNKDAKIDVVAIGESCELVEKFLDDAENWNTWSKRMNAMALLGGNYSAENLTNDDFKNFILSESPRATLLAPPEGNKEMAIEPLGTPCFSSSEPHHVELIFIKALNFILDYLQGARFMPNFENPRYKAPQRPEAKTFTEDEWEKVPEDYKPQISTVDPDAMKEAVRQERRWKKFAETGQAPDSDFEDPDSDSEDYEEAKKASEKQKASKSWDTAWDSMGQ